MKTLFTFFLLYFAVFPVYGSSFDVPPFSQAVQNTSSIVKGEIGMSYSDWGTDIFGGKRIYTYYQLQVDTVIKGDISQKNIVIREMGGEKDGEIFQITGTSKFKRGEIVVVFLRDQAIEGAYDIDGMMLGKYNLQTNDAGEESLVGPGISMAQPLEKWTLNQLIHLVKTQNHLTSEHDKKTISVNHPQPTSIHEKKELSSLRGPSNTTSHHEEDFFTSSEKTLDNGDKNFFHSQKIFFIISLFIGLVGLKFIFNRIKRG